MNKFIEINFAANQKALKPTDEFIVRAWEIFCAKHHTTLSEDAIRSLCRIENKTKVYGISANTAFSLEWDVSPPLDGAELYPDEFQPWEREGRQLCTRDGDGLFSLTDHGSILKDKLLAEIEKYYNLHLNKIGSNKYLYLLII